MPPGVSDPHLSPLHGWPSTRHIVGPQRSKGNVKADNDSSNRFNYHSHVSITACL